MMNFRVIAAAGTELLATAGAGLFRVVGQRNQKSDASEFKGNNRRVQFYYASGDFPKSGGRQTGDTQHHLTFNVDLSVSSQAAGDAATLQNPSSSAAAAMAVLSAVQDASYLADQAMDDLAERVYQILMDANNFDLGLSKGVMSSRWVGSLRKDDPLQMGNLVALTARFEYTCQTAETITGEAGVALTGGIDTVVDIVGDDEERTGVLSS